MDGDGVGIFAAVDHVTVGVPAFAALEADIEALVERLAEECEQGVISQVTANELSAIVGRAKQLNTSA